MKSIYGASQARNDTNKNRKESLYAYKQSERNEYIVQTLFMHEKRKKTWHTYPIHYRSALTLSTVIKFIFSKCVLYRLPPFCYNILSILVHVNIALLSWIRVDKFMLFYYVLPYLMTSSWCNNKYSMLFYAQ